MAAFPPSRPMAAWPYLMAQDRIDTSYAAAVADTALEPRMLRTPLLEESIGVEDARGSQRGSLLGRLLLGADVPAALVGASAGAWIGGIPADVTFIFMLVVALAWPLVVFCAGLYAVDTLGTWASGIAHFGRLAGVALLVSWPVAGLASILGAAHAVPAALTAASTTLLLSLAGRTAARALVHRVDPLRQRTLVVGSGVVAARFVERLHRHDELGLEPVGLVDDEVHAVPELDLPVLGRLRDLRDVIQRQQIDRVIITFTRASHEELLAALRACREERVPVDVVPRLFEFLEGARAIERIGGLPVLSIGAQRLPKSSAIAKRGLDIVCSLLALIVLAPLFFVLAAAIKLESPGPVFFRQPRAGRKGTVFTLFKFRSMYEGADLEKAELEALNEVNDGVMFKIRDDPRVSAVGRVIRRLSIDELPQLINVLRGDMSLVGPRPLVLPESDALGGSWHARRLDLRPGLTGPWQISGRSDLSVHDMVRLDFQYVTGWSLARDIEIILATVPAVLRGRGAY